MPRKLQKGRPYGYVMNLPGVVWEQDNLYFNAAGRHVDETGNLIEIEVALPVPEVVSASAQYDRMSDAALRAMVGQYGGEWTGKDDAIAFLVKGGE